MQVFEWQGKRDDSRTRVCKETALQNADGYGPAVFPPAELALNLIECRRIHEPPRRNLISLRSFDFLKLHQQQNQIHGGR